MSKSKGEFLTVSLLESKGYDPLAYRFFCLGSHYRKSLTFSYENLDNAVIAYEKLISRIAAIKDEGESGGETAEKCRESFMTALANDVNTSLAITALYDTLKADISGKAKLELIADFDRVLALDLIKNAEKLKAKEENGGADASDPLTAYILEKIEARKNAKKEKNYALADAIRAELAEKGVTLIDTPEGTKFKIGE
jgi:cysteinyl-tRNA synthetase